MAKKVLVIDDDPDVSDLLSMRLASFGYEILSARNGAEGCFKSAEAQPSLIFLDLTMPGEGGLAVLKKLKREMSPAVREIPVIVLTGHETFEQDCAAAGAAGYITKPFDLFELKEILAKHLPGDS